MPRYYFDVHDGTERRDPVGRELDGFEQASREAGTIVASVAANELPDNPDITVIVNVRDGSGAGVLILRMVCQAERI